MVKDTLANFCSLILTALLLPVLLLQGLMVKMRTPILPGASGEPAGLIQGGGEPVDLVVFGESTVAGIGVDTYDQALAAQTASALAETLGRSVRWRAVGRSGMTARDLHAGFFQEGSPSSADIIIISLGVNDVLHMHSPGRYFRDLCLAIAEVRRIFGDIPVVIAGIAPVGTFPAIPHPLRLVLGLRVRVLDRAAGVLSRSLKNVYHCPGFNPARSDGIDACFAGDGFHPNPLGYSLMGKRLGAFIVQTVYSPAEGRKSP